MKARSTLLLGALGCASLTTIALAAGITISGAGATFPYPLYAKWAEAYGRETGVKLNYQAVGSAGGIEQITQGTVDFGASDVPLKPEELDEARLVQFPVVVGGVVPVVNLASVKAGELRLTPELLADVYLGKIRKWNDAKIVAANVGLKMPDTAITVVHRSDGSGTTWIFTNYLSKVSKEWAQTVGNDRSVAWPVGVAGDRDQGVAAKVQRIAGAIGYVETAYAVLNRLAEVKLKNHAGHFVADGEINVQAAAAAADWKDAKRFYLVLTDQPGADAWPITGATFVLVRRKQQRPDVAREVLKFFHWGYRKGGDAALKLLYVPVPAAVVDLVERSWEHDLKDESGGKIWPAERHASE